MTTHLRLFQIITNVCMTVQYGMAVLVGWVGLDGWIVGWVGGRMNGCLVGWVVECVDGWMGGQLVGWVDSWMNEWLDRWMDG